MSDTVVAGQIVSRETMQGLRQLEALVRRWNPAINLISKASVATIWDRHIVDSAQIFSHCPATARRWLDIGSGAGFPGLVVALLAKEHMPDLRITLVEADGRKATFLRQAITALAVSADVITDRVEGLPPQQADVISARAVAALVDLLPYTVLHIASTGVALFPKGARHAEEVTAARRVWDFDVESHASVSAPDAAILIIRNIERAKQS